MTLPGEIETWLAEKGVSLATLNKLPAISFASVEFVNDYALPVAMDETDAAAKALMLPCHDGESVFDWAAWSPKLNKLALVAGTGFAVGNLDDIWNPATYFDKGALALHRDPLEWLRAGRDGGLVVMQWKLARIYLVAATRLSVPDARAKKSVQKWLAPRPSRVDIRVAKVDQARAP